MLIREHIEENELLDGEPDVETINVLRMRTDGTFVVTCGHRAEPDRYRRTFPSRAALAEYLEALIKGAW